ncbi:3-oxoacyl-ACP synthase [Proteinivorax tanatarense]|uniref:3-oxoacyl-ACP synthase n=1 Tax=Proteinivorax tanatarense TaxID=1260629 RepID=A0AAU7VNE7_9FIRM
MENHVGIVGTGLYIPETFMTAKDIAEETKGLWTEEAVKEKLGINRKPIPAKEGDGTQEMGVKAGKKALENTGVDPMDIDLIICMGEEWKEYPLTTSGIYIQEQIGAKNAWAIDVQQRCCTTVAAMKIAKDMMMADSNINTAMIVGGYRNGDFVDYTDKSMSMMYNLSAGGGAIILKKNYGKNALLSSHILTDGSLARSAGVEYGGTEKPITSENAEEANKSLRLFQPQFMKERLNEVSMKNWVSCIDQAFIKSGVKKEELGYLAVLHFKKSMHMYMIDLLGLTEEQSIYLSDYGHMGQVDQILSLELALKEGKIENGTVISMIAAGIGYAWAANVIKWGPVNN